MNNPIWDQVWDYESLSKYSKMVSIHRLMPRVRQLHKKRQLQIYQELKESE
jgi:hypothetical protein